MVIDVAAARMADADTIAREVAECFPVGRRPAEQVPDTPVLARQGTDARPSPGED
jgi:hypothetical protein